MTQSSRILRRPEVERRTGLKRSSLYAAVASGRFPAPVKLTTRSVGWLEQEVNAWIDDRAAHRACIESTRGVAR